ncbi:hypothetical protein QQ045_021240 [Rhodiola kirilowii]
MNHSNLTLLTLLGLLLASHVKSQGWSAPSLPNHPLCPTQINLLNHACSAIPLYSVPPPAQPSPPPPSNETSSSHSRRRNRRHRSHHHHHHGTPNEEECCRWLQTVDAECVCNVLLAMPTFLARPLHQYTVTVDDTCRITYTCPSRIFGR